MQHKLTRRQQADNTKGSIILALLKLLETKEIQNITIREIAKTAGVSTGSFYVYFASKEAALLYVYRGLDETFEELTLGEDALANLRRVLVAYLSLASGESLPFLRKIYVAHLTYHDEYFFSEERPLFRLLQAQVAALKPGQDAAKATWKLLDYCRGCFYNLCIKPPPQSLDAWRQEIVEDIMAWFA